MIHVTLNSSHIGEPNQAPEHKPASSQVLVDLGTRMSHASMAMAFFISYLTSESEYWRIGARLQRIRARRGG